MNEEISDDVLAEPIGGKGKPERQTMDDLNLRSIPPWCKRPFDVHPLRPARNVTKTDVRNPGIVDLLGYPTDRDEIAPGGHFDGSHERIARQDAHVPVVRQIVGPAFGR